MVYIIWSHLWKTVCVFSCLVMYESMVIKMLTEIICGGISGDVYIFFVLLDFFCFSWCGQIMSSELIDLCFSISECSLLLVLFCFFSSDTNMARSPEHILSCQGAQCKSILYAVVPTKSSYSHWSCFASQSTPEPITVPKANVDWPVLGYMPKYPGLRVGEGSFLTETLCTLSRMWVNYRELLSEYVPSKGGGGKSWTTVSSTVVRKINNC